MSSPRLTGSVLTISLRSPFARRARLALLRAGAKFEVQTVNPLEPTPELYALNPLGLVPVLKLEGGATLIDSSSIIEAAHDWTGSIWSSDMIVRNRERQASALAEGLMTAAVSYFLETQRKTADVSWLEDHIGVADRTIAVIAQAGCMTSPWISGGEPTQAGWDLGVALEYLELRMPQVEWRTRCPEMVALLGVCRQSEAFRQTTPPPMS